MGSVQTPDHKQVRSVPHTQSHTPFPRRSHSTLCGTSRPLVAVHSYPRSGYTPVFLLPHLTFQRTRTEYLLLPSAFQGHGSERDRRAPPSIRRAFTPGVTCHHASAPASVCCTGQKASLLRARCPDGAWSTVDGGGPWTR